MSKIKSFMALGTIFLIGYGAETLAQEDFGCVYECDVEVNSSL